MCILHRDLGAHFVRGVTPDRYLANYMGRSGGVTGGKDGNMHFGDRELGCVGMVSMLPDMAPVATGMAMAFKARGEARVAMTFFGEGSTANGQWHEAMNLAGVQRLPVVFILENNQFAYSTPNELEFAVDPVERARTYGFPGVTVDGNDVEAVFEAAREAVERARRGDGPTLIEARTMRMHGHGAHDDMSYVPPEMFEEWSRARPDRPLPRAPRRRPRLLDGRGRLAARRGAGIRRRVREEGARLADARPGDRHRGRLRRDVGAAGRRGGAVVASWAASETEGRHDDAGGGAAAPTARDDLPRGDLRRPARGDAPRRDGDLLRRGHRRVRRRLQDHRRVLRGVRRRPGDRRPARRERDHRRRRRRRDRGPEAGLRDAVRRLHLLRLRPARQRRREAPLPPGRRRADGRPAALGRRLLRRAVPLAEPGGLVPPGAGPEGGGARVRGRRQGPAGQRDPRSEPGLLPRAQGALPQREGRGPEGEHTVRWERRASSARAAS